MRFKSGKYGQHVWIVIDKDAYYVLNAFTYFGKDDNRPGDQSLCDFVVKEKIELLYD